MQDPGATAAGKQQREHAAVEEARRKDELEKQERAA
jgi:hypothetical protein